MPSYPIETFGELEAIVFCAMFIALVAGSCAIGSLIKRRNRAHDARAR